MYQIKLAENDDEVEACYPVFAQLRTQVTRAEFIDGVKRQAADGYRLAYLGEQGIVRAVAGFRMSESFAWKRYLYIDDLVTADTERSRGYGGALFDWLVELARANDCDQLHLESGVQRFDAHRFYLCRGMAISSHHFQLVLRSKA